MAQENKTFCSAFWNHTNIRSGDRIFPCCRFKYPTDQFDGYVGNILYSENYQELRQKSQSGIPIKGCEKCYLEEKLGKESLRQQFNKKYTADSISIKYLEIGFDNICNLTCDGCWEEFSSSWSKLKNPEADKKSHIVSITEIKDNPGNLEKVVFLGGEPLMTNRHERFLADIAYLENLEVIYHTNGTFLLNDSTINLLRSCKTVTFIVSIDGVGELNDKVRSGSSWNKVLEFISQIKSLGFVLSIHSVIHKNNWFGFKDLADFIDEISLRWSIGVLTYPQELSIINLSSKDKQNLITSIDDRIPNRDFIINFLKNGTDRKQRTVYQLEKV